MGNEDSVLIECKDLTAGYGKTPVLSGVDFTVSRGEIVALIGENGSGKSTLLRTVTGELKPISGDIRIRGKDLRNLSAREIAHTMAIVMTSRVSPDYFTCFDMVSSGRYPYTDAFGRLKEEDRRAVSEAMELTNTSSLADRYLTDISDGQRQLVMLSRAIAQEPDILILDEPVSFLDIRHRLLFAEAVRTIVSKRHTAVLMSMHELDLVRSLSDRFIALKDGKVDRDDDSSTLDEAYIRELFRLPSDGSLNCIHI